MIYSLLYLYYIVAEDFASAEATRGLSGRPLDPFGFATTGVDFFRRGNRACGRDGYSAFIVKVNV